jgi:ssDNA-binding Zn-finger/Zn-ribbon topoisomerase 1
MSKILDWYPIQTCPKCHKQYDPYEKLTECPQCKIKLEMKKPRVHKGIQL